MIRNSETVASRRRIVNGKLKLAGSTVLVATIIGTAGVAAAAPSINDNSSNTSSQGPSNAQMCKNDFEQFGFKNVGQCVSWWEHEHDGHGYGGNKHHHHHHFDFGSFENFFKQFFH